MSDYAMVYGLAKAAREYAVPKISGYKVGAALIVFGDPYKKIYRGCNIEFANFSNTIHAEEAAIANAVTMNGPIKIDILAVVTGDADRVWYPCGMCLQSIYELSTPDTVVVAGNLDHWEWKYIKDLLPHGFMVDLAAREKSHE